MTQIDARVGLINNAGVVVVVVVALAAHAFTWRSSRLVFV